MKLDKLRLKCRIYLILEIISFIVAGILLVSAYALARVIPDILGVLAIALSVLLVVLCVCCAGSVSRIRLEIYKEKYGHYPKYKHDPIKISSGFLRRNWYFNSKFLIRKQ